MAGRGADEGRRKLPGSGRGDPSRPRPEVTAPRTEKPRWSADRRAPSARGCPRRKVRIDKDAPFGAPSPRFWRGARGRPRKAGEDYGVPGAAKNTGDDACLGAIPEQARHALALATRNIRR